VGNLSTRLPWLVCAAIVVIPAFAYGDSEPPLTGSIQAYDIGFENPATHEPTVTIAAGGTVTFSYPSGGNSHNIDFFDKQPASCTQTAGSDEGSVRRCRRSRWARAGRERAASTRPGRTSSCATRTRR
jgi:hypothetical protein